MKARIIILSILVLGYTVAAHAQAVDPRRAVVEDWLASMPTSDQVVDMITLDCPTRNAKLKEMASAKDARTGERIAEIDARIAELESKKAALEAEQ